jgi:deferrochelatase/peroxidase EfeB
VSAGEAEPVARRYSRRALLGAFGAGAVAAAGVGVAGTALVRSREEDAPQAAASAAVPFHGVHQAGITTPVQDYLHFVSLDLTTSSRDEVVALLKGWTAAAASMTAGDQVGTYGAVNGPYDAPPEDTGEALGLPASNLTITVGFGPSLFRTEDGVDRFGIAGQQPATLQDLPHFPGDVLDDAISRGDLCIQACANDSQVAVHAIRNLVRIGFGTAGVRWSQTGFGKSSATTHAGPTPRNLFGFKDGTANITADQPGDLEDFVWVQSGDGPAWMAGGSYLAARKIRMTIETWDRTSLREQEAVFGRTKREGAPLSGGGEFDQPDFGSAGNDGAPLVPATSHMALAHPSNNAGMRILRRAFNYTDGSDDLGRLDAGLFFLAYQRDLERQFIPLQMQLSRSDRMNEYVRYLSSSAFAIPPGAQPGGFIGETLFA